MKKSKIQILLELAKVRITIVVTLTTALGYVLFTGTIDKGLFFPALGLFLLACGSAVFNHIQERRTDAMMTRTKERPLPSGAISVRDATYFAVALAFSGLIILFESINITGALLGLTAMIWYNVIYTPLKHRSSLAVIPGSLIGALPPIIGWVAGGGYFLDPQILIVAFYFFIWQIPHFWLLLLIYDKDYNEAGIPTLTLILSKKQLERITFSWIVATVFIALTVPLVSAIRHESVHYFLLVGALVLIWKSLNILKPKLEINIYRELFMNINFFTLFFIFILAFDKLIS